MCEIAMSTPEEICRNWRFIKMVPLGKSLKVHKIGIHGVDSTKLPFEIDGSITVKDFKKGLETFYDHDEDPEIYESLHDPEDESIALHTVTVEESGNKVTYRCPMVYMTMFTTIADGMVMVESARKHGLAKSAHLIPFEFTFGVEAGHEPLSKQVAQLLSFTDTLDKVSLTRV